MASIEELVELIRQGSEQAAAQFVCEYGEHIKREARRKMADDRLLRFFDQSDVFQSVMISFVLKVRMGTFSITEANELLGLLVNMTRNKVADQFRQLSAQKRDYRRHQADPEQRFEAATGENTPSQILSLNEQLQKLEEKIPGDIREIATRRKNGESWQDIASQLGENSDALRKRYSRMIERLEVELFDEPS